jgi:CDP-glucose 4,6-dehydratase
LAPPSQPSNFELSDVRGRLALHEEGDVRDFARLRSALERAAPDFVFHLAAQSLVREGYAAPRETFEVNFMGTANVLEAVRQLRVSCPVVVVTSDKCYENREWSWGYRESDALGGRDPYSASKGAAEVLVSSYRRSFFPPESIPDHGVRLASARAGNVIGGGDWSRDHIAVDVLDALSSGSPVRVRNPDAVRPWQHILESLSGYLTLASALSGSDAARYCDAWNFGPETRDTRPVRELVEMFIACWGSGSWRDASDANQPHEAGFLRLSIDKALVELGWTPRWCIEETVRQTVSWYRSFRSDPRSCQAKCLEQITCYEASSPERE